jgi:hypothetical protein
VFQEEPIDLINDTIGFSHAAPRFVFAPPLFHGFDRCPLGLPVANRDRRSNRRRQMGRRSDRGRARAARLDRRSLTTFDPMPTPLRSSIRCRSCGNQPHPETSADGHEPRGAGRYYAVTHDGDPDRCARVTSTFMFLES